LGKVFSDERVFSQLFDWNPIVLVHLKALNHEQAGFDTCWICKADFVAAVINFCHQIFHLKAVEWRDTNEHLVEHDTECPSVDFGAITALLEELGARVEWGATDGQVRVSAVEDGRQAEV